MKLIIDIDNQTFDKLTEYGEPLSAGNGFHDSILKAVANGKPLPFGMRFTVIDKKTGKEADEYEIALKEDWAKDLMYCDMEGFAILQDGTLILVDECGSFAYCPADRFEIVFEDNEADMKGEKE